MVSWGGIGNVGGVGGGGGGGGLVCGAGAVSNSIS